MKKMSKKQAIKTSATVSLSVSIFTSALTVSSVLSNATNSAIIGVLLFTAIWPLTLLLVSSLVIIEYLEEMNPFGGLTDVMGGDD